MWIFFAIFREKGVVGLFKGLEAKLLQTVLTASLMFLVYEKLMKLIMVILKVKNKADWNKTSKFGIKS